MSIHASSQHSVFITAEGEIPAELAPAAIDARYPERASTQHFRVFYEAALGDVGPALADHVLENCENDYDYLRATFGGITPPGLPFSVYVISGFGAKHDNCRATVFTCGIDDGTRPDLLSMLVVAEATECFEAALQRGWDCRASNGEALSRVLATELYPDELRTYVSGPTWLVGNRPDWVTRTEPTDRNYESIGCGTLFLNFLGYQLGHTWDQVAVAGGATLAQTYSTLTGRADGFARFKALLDARYPPGMPVDLTTDNPFPLPEP